MLKHVFIIALLVRGLIASASAQQAILEVTPIVYGTPLTAVTYQNKETFTKLEHALKDEVIQTLADLQINPDSCEIIDSDENWKYTYKPQGLDISYTYCKIRLENGHQSHHTSIHYNGFAKALSRPKLFIQFLKSKDESIQSVLIYFYRGLPEHMIANISSSIPPKVGK